MELERQLFARLLDYPLLVLTKSGADEKRHHYLQKMIIKRLTIAHTKDVFNLLQHVAADMSAKGIQQWNSNYPTLEHVLGDIESDSLFAAFQGNEIIGVIAMDDKQSPEYTAIPWKYNSARDCRTIFEIAGFTKEDLVKPEVAHDALSDAVAQAQSVAKAFRTIKGE